MRVSPWENPLAGSRYSCLDCALRSSELVARGGTGGAKMVSGDICIRSRAEVAGPAVLVVGELLESGMRMSDIGAAPRLL